MTVLGGENGYATVITIFYDKQMDKQVQVLVVFGLIRKKDLFVDKPTDYRDKYYPVQDGYKNDFRLEIVINYEKESVLRAIVSLRALNEYAIVRKFGLINT